MDLGVEAEAGAGAGAGSVAVEKDHNDALEVDESTEVHSSAGLPAIVAHSPGSHFDKPLALGEGAVDFEHAVCYK
jgi:hypothetical protein